MGAIKIEVSNGRIEAYACKATQIYNGSIVIREAVRISEFMPISADYFIIDTTPYQTSMNTNYAKVVYREDNHIHRIVGIQKWYKNRLYAIKPRNAIVVKNGIFTTIDTHKYNDPEIASFTKEYLEMTFNDKSNVDKVLILIGNKIRTEAYCIIGDIITYTDFDYEPMGIVNDISIEAETVIDDYFMEFYGESYQPTTEEKKKNLFNCVAKEIIHRELESQNIFDKLKGVSIEALYYIAKKYADENEFKKVLQNLYEAGLICGTSLDFEEKIKDIVYKIFPYRLIGAKHVNFDQIYTWVADSKMDIGVGDIIKVNTSRGNRDVVVVEIGSLVGSRKGHRKVISKINDPNRNR